MTSRQGHRHLVEQPGPDVAEPLVALLGGQVDHPEAPSGGPPRSAMNPSTSASAVSYPAALPAPSPPTISVSEPPSCDHLLGQHQDGRLDLGEVLVEGGRRGAGPAGDVDDLEVAVAGRSASRPCARAGAGGWRAPAPRHPPVGGPQLVVVGIAHRRRACAASALGGREVVIGPRLLSRERSSALGPALHHRAHPKPRSRSLVVAWRCPPAVGLAGCGSSPRSAEPGDQRRRLDGRTQRRLDGTTASTAADVRHLARPAPPPIDRRPTGSARSWSTAPGTRSTPWSPTTAGPRPCVADVHPSVAAAHRHRHRGGRRRRPPRPASSSWWPGPTAPSSSPSPATPSTASPATRQPGQTNGQGVERPVVRRQPRRQPDRSPADGDRLDSGVVTPISDAGQADQAASTSSVVGSVASSEMVLSSTASA